MENSERQPGDANAGRAERISALEARIVALGLPAQRLQDISLIKRLQRAYGYYIDQGYWQEAADLFADDGHLRMRRGRHVCRQSPDSRISDAPGRRQSGTGSALWPVKSSDAAATRDPSSRPTARQPKDAGARLPCLVSSRTTPPGVTACMKMNI